MTTRRRFHGWFVASLCLAVGWFFLWTVRSTAMPWKFGQEQRDYYNLLIDGWLDGQLHMKVDVPDALLQLADPYDPLARPPGLALHDASFFRGKYYLYFGAGPIVALMLPFRVVTGVDLPLPLAVLIFTTGGFLLSLAVFLNIRRRYFSGTTWIVSAAAVLGLGLAALLPVLLRRPQIWELPIAAGYCFAMGTLLALWRSLHSRRGTAWLVVAGASLGLAIASRPTYLLVLPLMGAPLFVWWRETRRLPWRAALVGAAPLVVIGALMALHNHLRFGSALEFGQAYQFSFDREGEVRHFGIDLLPYHLRAYFFGPAGWNWYFPFIEPGELPPRPAGAGQHAYDRVFGVLRNLPLAWFALAAPLVLCRRAEVARRRLGAWLGATTLLFGSMALLFACFFIHTARYMLDFTPALMLLAVVGVLGIEHAAVRWNPWWRAAARILWGGATLFAAGFAILFSFQVNGLFREQNPRGYAAVARAANHLPAAIERLAGRHTGPLVLALKLGSRPAGTEAPLVTLHGGAGADRLLVRYSDPEHVVLCFLPASGPEVVSAPLRINLAGSHHVRLLSPGLLPPETHPAFARAEPQDITRLLRRVRVEFDGRPVIDAPHRRETPVRVLLATEGMGGGIVSTQREVLNVSLARPRHFVRLRLRFPVGAAGARDPLVSWTGSDGGNVLFVEYLGADRARLGGSFAGEELLSPDIALASGRVQEVACQIEETDRPDRARVLVWLGGAMIWVADVPTVAASLEKMLVAKSLVPFAKGTTEFTGTVFSADIGQGGRDPLSRPGDTIRMQVRLPQTEGAGPREPLVITGRPGEGDQLALEYVGPEHVRFWFDHWGSPATVSELVPLDSTFPHEFEIRLGSLAAPSEDARREHSGLLRVTVNGRVVWEQDARYYATAADEVSVGRNPIGGSLCSAEFSGEILRAERISSGHE